MKLENLTESMLNEIFNAGQSGTEYPVENLTPNAKVPQMLHVKAPGTNDLIVRLTHLDTVGTRVKAVVPGDKTVQVFLMSLSDKGNITDWRGGLGSDPVGAISSIFVAIMEIAKKYQFESILFRFTKSKTKGRGEIIKRILTKLIVRRSAGRFTDLDEVTRAESKKFDFVLAIRKNSDLMDELVKDAPGFTKVETKAGDTFVNTETGEQVSKAEVAASVLTSQSAKVTDQQIVSKTKISRKDAYAAMYTVGVNFQTKRGPDSQKKFDKLQSKVPVIASSGTPTPIIDVLNDPEQKNTLPDVGASLRQWVPNVNFPFDDSIRNKAANAASTLANKLESMFSPKTPKHGEALLRENLEFIANVVETTPITNLMSGISKLATHFSSGVFATLEQDDRKTLMKASIDILIAPASILIMRGYVNKQAAKTIEKGFGSDITSAVVGYTGARYSDMNNFLIGKTGTITEQTFELIQDLDKGFAPNKGGVTLPKDVILYRGMNMPSEQLQVTLESKIMYFANFVSTSFLPVIFTGAFAATVSPLDTSAVDVTDTPFVDVLDTQMFSNTARETYEYTKKAPQVSVGMIISGADKINVIVPGGVSANEWECEVILPRGVAMRVTKFLAPPADMKYYDDNAIMYLEIINPDELNESNADIIDGDKFLAEGVVETLSFSSLFKSTLTEAKLDTNLSQEAIDLILGCLDFSEMPDRFM